MLKRPLFVVAPPYSGAEAIVRSLGGARGVWTCPDRSGIIDDIPRLSPATRRWESDRLTASDLDAEVTRELHRHLEERLTDREGHKPGSDDAPLRWLDATPAHALRIPFLTAVAPDAGFIYLHRDPSETLPAMWAGWRSERMVTYRDLPGWEGPKWSFPLISGWQELAGSPLPQIVTEQWLRIATTLLDDLEKLPPERWYAIDHALLTKDPRAVLTRICAFADIEVDDVAQTLMLRRRASSENASRIQPRAPRELETLLTRTAETAERSREMVTSLRRVRRRVDASSPSSFRSVYTESFPRLLDHLGSSLLITTYQAGKLICARHDSGGVNTHFHSFDRPMGIAVDARRFALGTRSEVLDYRSLERAAEGSVPHGEPDAAFLPLNRHLTGDIKIHEVAFAEEVTWVVNTSFSCLATLDADHSFVPRWMPPFITALRPDDRCHLNGACVIANEIRFTTALGRSDEPGGWRPDKAGGGILMEVPSGEIVLEGLSMPHSPRWYDGRLWFLESGKGSLAVADLDAGTWETVCQLPGFTRGLTLIGGLAFVGLSTIRESATFGGLPLHELVEERLCGVWAVNIESGEIVGFLRFEEEVREVFDVAVLPGIRFPQIADAASALAVRSYVLPS